MPHSDRCRKRIMEKLAETPAGRIRIGRATDRLDNFIAEQISRHDQKEEHGPTAQGEIGGLGNEAEAA